MASKAAEDLRTCPVCMDYFDCDMKIPKFLSCYHTLCYQCLMTLSEKRVEIACPLCRHLTGCYEGVEKLRNNTYLMQIMAEEPNSRQCSKCGRKPHPRCNCSYDMVVKMDDTQLLVSLVNIAQTNLKSTIVERLEMSKNLNITINLFKNGLEHVENYLKFNEKCLTQLSNKLAGMKELKLRFENGDMVLREYIKQVDELESEWIRLSDFTNKIRSFNQLLSDSEFISCISQFLTQDTENEDHIQEEGYNNQGNFPTPRHDLQFQSEITGETTPERSSTATVPKKKHFRSSRPSSEREKISSNEAILDNSHVLACAWNPRDNSLTCALSSGQIQFFSQNSKASNSKWDSMMTRLDDGPVCCLDWDITGSKLAVGSLTGIVFLFNGIGFSALDKHKKRINCIKWNRFGKPNLLLSSSSDLLVVWDSIQECSIHCIEPPTGNIGNVEWISRYNFISSIEDNGKSIIYQVGEKKALREIRCRCEKKNILFSLERNLGRQIRLYCSHSGRLRKFRCSYGAVNIYHVSVESSAFGNTFASVFHNRIQIWQLEQLKLECVLEGHSTDIMKVAFSPDGSLLASSSLNELFVWSSETWRKILQCKYENQCNVGSLVWNDSGDKIAVCLGCQDPGNGEPFVHIVDVCS